MFSYTLWSHNETIEFARQPSLEVNKMQKERKCYILKRCICLIQREHYLCLPRTNFNSFKARSDDHYIVGVWHVGVMMAIDSVKNFHTF